MGLKPRRKPLIRDHAAQLTAEVRGSAAAQTAADVLEAQRKAILEAAGASDAARQKKILRDQAALLRAQSRELYALAKDFEKRKSDTSLPQRKRRRVKRRTKLSVVEVTLPRLLREHRGNASAIAAEMETSRVQIHRWCKHFGYVLDDFREVAYEPPDLYSRDYLAAKIPELLAKHAGSVAAVARDLGRNRSSINRWCERLGIEPSDFRASRD